MSAACLLQGRKKIEKNEKELDEQNGGNQRYKGKRADQGLNEKKERNKCHSTRNACFTALNSFSWWVPNHQYWCARTTPPRVYVYTYINNFTSFYFFLVVLFLFLSFCPLSYCCVAFFFVIGAMGLTILYSLFAHVFVFECIFERCSSFLIYLTIEWKWKKVWAVHALRRNSMGLGQREL